MSVFSKEKLRQIKEEENKKKNEKKKHTIMIVDDEEGNLESLKSLLIKEYHIITANNGVEALDLITKMEHPGEISVIISDQSMPKLTGIELFEKVKEIIPDTMRIILTAYDEKGDIINAINKAKVHEYLMKDTEQDELKHLIKRTIEMVEIKRELEAYRANELKNAQDQFIQVKNSFIHESPLKYSNHFEHIVTQNKTMRNIFKYIEDIAEFNVPILITGETGTGKELIVKAIHKIYQETNKINGKFVADNVASWNEELFNDTLFGHKKGSFTDASSDREGFLEQAVNGTTFLDEIGDLKLTLQAKLLRLLQEKVFFPIGSDKPRTTNTRFVFATNKDINAMKNEGKFREDLFFRLNTHQIYLPPLRERKDDIPHLLDYFIREAMEEYKKTEKPVVTRKLITLLTNHHFPGNVRELRSMVFEAVCIHKDGELRLDVFIKKIKEQGGEVNDEKPGNSTEREIASKEIVSFGEILPTFDQMVKLYTQEAMLRSGNNQSRAAEKTGLNRSKFRRFL